MSILRHLWPRSTPKLLPYTLFLSCLAGTLSVLPVAAHAPTSPPDTPGAPQGGELGAPVTATGKLHIVHADDMDHQRSHFMYHLEDERTKRFRRLHFLDTPPAHRHAGARATVRGHAHGEDIVIAAANDADLAPVAPALAAAVAGEQKTLVIMANFQDAAVSCSASTIRDTLFTDPMARSIDDLYQETSYGQLWFTGEVYGAYTLNYRSTDPCDFYAWSSAAEAAAQVQGVNTSAYTRKVFVLPRNNACGYIGLGTVGGYPSQSWVFACDMPDVFGHELGHNLGTQHASTPSSEYGDYSDIMGVSGIGLRHMNAPHKEAMGWLPSTQVSTITQDGTYTIAPLELNPVDTVAPQVLKIAKRDTNEVYYFSYRRPIGFDASLSTAYTDRVNVHRYASSGTFTYFLQALSDGGRFQDTVNGITVTQVRHDATSATVQVSMSCTPAAPSLSVSPSSQRTTPGTTVRYTVSVTNTDSAACPQAALALTSTVPAGWTSSLTPSSLSLAPGATATATVALTAPTGTSVGSYSSQVRVGDTLVAAHVAAATVSTTIDAPIAADTTPPTAPTALRATVRSNKIQLSWNAASDNVGVSGYAVWRNGVKIATTSNLSYTDGSTRSGVYYTYYIIAFDRAGNLSVASPAVTVKR